MQPPYRDYLPDDDKPPLPDDWDQPPRPGHGPVLVRFDDDGLGEWSAVWYDRRYTEISGSKAEVLAWARAQPGAEHTVWIPSSEREVALDSEEARSYLGEE